MKPHEILSMLPQWSSAAPGILLDSPAWAMPCRLDETSSTLHIVDLKPCDTLDLAMLLDGERHVLSIADSPRFADLHALWASRGVIPEAILLALVERECSGLLQLVENAVRRQLKIEGLAADNSEVKMLFAQAEDVVFGLTKSSIVEDALGQLRFIDCTHESIRDIELPYETELASFVLSAADLASLAVGDALVLPEVGTVPPRLVIDGRFAVDGNGVVPFKDDGRLRVVSAETGTMTLGKLFDRAQGLSAENHAGFSQLKLLSAGNVVAFGRLDKLSSQPAFFVEAN